MRSVERYGRAGAVVAGLTCCLITGAAVPAVAMQDRLGPSAEEVARARSKAGERSKQLGATTALLARAKARLGELSAQADRLIELHAGERAETARAEELLRRARERAAAGADKPREAVAAVPGRGDVVPGRGDGGPTPVRDVGGAAVIPLRGDSGVAAPVQSDGMAVSPPPDVAEVLQAQTEAAQAGAAQAEAVRAEIDYRERWAAAERAAEAARAAEEAVAGQAAEVQRIEADRTRLDKEMKAEAGAAERLAGKRVAVLKWSRVAQERARLGDHRSAAVARMRARFVAAREVAGQTWPLNATWQAARGDIAADWALTQLDKPYVWAGTGPRNYDCSGLTMRAWARAGVRIDHWTGTQWTSGQHVRISRLRRGDLLFFGRITRNPGDISHVGIYIGRGLMVHAPQTGDVVRVAPIWRRDFVGATRPA
ncbi:MULTISPECIES: C40 family peptidase [Streptosporangium]|uniref:Cell wall-associated NlpC family hydrolase n=1 Tax=Streptosporangium brasiliense TaxID=47480 RepID=A0ABT9R673_9ACTN|nr:C40 family peptidase [Streptosporangium brasiliense]MDP9864367.1 cell wall-associated NlpC family hydrolase [Streptosporangium brasiliense]